MLLSSYVNPGEMQTKRIYKAWLRPTAALLLSSVLLAACGTSGQATKPAEERELPADSVKKFVPLHPPVVIPHSWKETK